MSERSIIAVDLGAESGRVMRVGFDGARLHMHEAHRFPNVPVRVRDTLHWDVLRLWGDVLTGLKAALPGASSIGVDTWGVDFALLDREGRLVSNPVHYRDSRTEGMMDWVFNSVPRREVFERTGIQFMAMNGLYQLASLVRSDSPQLKHAATLVTIADLFNYWLSGSRTCEFTHLTSLQMYDPRCDDWDRATLGAIGVPLDILPPVVRPGEQIGKYEGVPVIVPACHDTGSAVVGVPTTTADYAYISSGTWSLLGLELDAPVINDDAYAANLTNEGGAYGTFRLLKNIMGLWLAQGCRASWAAQGAEYDYETLVGFALDAPPFTTMIDPDYPAFFAPADMVAAIRAYCKETGQMVPESVGQVMRTVYESLALKYRYVLDLLRRVSGRTVEALHIIGGGSRNALLCQMTADATGCTVIAGPIEATAMGNAIVQLIALGDLSSLSEARTLLAQTVGTVTYEPRHREAWEAQYEKFKMLPITV